MQRCKNYTTKSNLNKHLNISCKIKKEKDDEKEQTFKLLLSKDKTITEQKEMIDKILEQNQILIKEIKDLKKIKNVSNSIKIKNNNSNIVNNTINNTINNNLVLVNFGKEDLNIIDKKNYLNKIVKKVITGVKIFDELLKIIYFNSDYPQFSNIYISDFNREKCMIYDNGKWKLSPFDKIPEVIEKIINFSYNSENELRPIFNENKSIISRLDTIKKYIQMNDNNYIEELKEEEEYNQNQITKCEEFQKKTYNTIKTSLYNEGKNKKKLNNN